MTQMTLGVIVGNRDFFPDRLVAEARADVKNLFAQMGLKAVMIGEDQGKGGSVETWAHAQECAALFDAHRHEIDGILVVLPNFGDERGVADTVKLSGLHVPILVQAYPDDLDELAVETRRDGFCGKISVCNNLGQYGYPFSLTEQHTVALVDPAFKQDLQRFVAVCRVVKGLRGARLGAIGARPSNFNTVRFSEKMLESAGISVATVDLSVMFGNAERLADDAPAVKVALDAIRAYLDAPGVPDESLVRMARLKVVIDSWMDENSLDATAIQCWDSIQQNYGVNACTLMSMMSDRLMPSACEVDITGALSMYALQLATGKPSALVDWNNNYGGDPDKCVLFHCGNWAKSFYESARMAYAEILATTLGKENSYGAIAGRVPAGPMSYARISTDDVNGRIRCYMGDGEFTDDPLNTFGSRAVVRIEGLQRLLQHICKNRFEHHVAMNTVASADILNEALGTYMGWDVYHHHSQA